MLGAVLASRPCTVFWSELNYDITFHDSNNVKVVISHAYIESVEISF